MSGAVLESEGSRQPGGDKPAAKGPTIELEDDHPAANGPTAEEAMAASRKAISDAETTTRMARQQAQEAQAEVVRVRAGQQQDQAAVLASAVEASTAERDRHAQAWQAAMEAGDFQAAAGHNKDMAMATAKLERASGELAMVRAGADQRQRQSAAASAQQSAVSQATMNWVAAHKEFDRHRDALILKHKEILNDGVTVDSPRYFRELDVEYDRLTGGGGQQDMGSGDRQHPRQQHFDGAPPGRGNGGSTGGGSSQSGTVQTLLGPVNERRVNGQRFITIPAHLRPDFAEGAKVVGMSIEDYAADQIDIARERAGGGTGGLISGEGNKYK